MNYLTEARRLGVDSIKYLTPVYGIANDFLGHNPLDLDPRPVREEDGLHVTGCFQCRGFRNAVRKSLAEERDWTTSPFEDVFVADGNPRIYDIEDMNRAFDEGRRTGLAEALRIVEKHYFYTHEELASLAFGGV